MQQSVLEGRGRGGGGGDYKNKSILITPVILQSHMLGACREKRGGFGFHLYFTH